MTLNDHTAGSLRIAEIVHDRPVIGSASDALDLLGNLYYQGFDGMIIPVHAITADFFDLRNGMAGEVLQKFSNYRMRLAIVGDFSAYTSKALQDFIRESNRGKHVCFVDSVAEALAVLAA